MKKYVKYALLTLTSVALAACASITLVKPGPVEIEGTYSVTADSAWNRIKQNDTDLWTLDGPLVQALSFHTGIEEGENIFERSGSESGPDAKFKNMPKFKKGMNAFDISEMVVATLAQNGNTGIKVAGLNRAKFGNRDGFKFELQYVDKESLERKALVFGTAAGEKLHLIIFQAPALFYFDRDRARVERMFESVRFKGASA